MPNQQQKSFQCNTAVNRLKRYYCIINETNSNDSHFKILDGGVTMLVLNTGSSVGKLTANV